MVDHGGHDFFRGCLCRRFLLGKGCDIDWRWFFHGFRKVGIWRAHVSRDCFLYVAGVLGDDRDEGVVDLFLRLMLQGTVECPCLLDSGLEVKFI